MKTVGIEPSSRTHCQGVCIAANAAHSVWEYQTARWECRKYASQEVKLQDPDQETFPLVSETTGVGRVSNAVRLQRPSAQSGVSIFTAPVNECRYSEPMGDHRHEAPRTDETTSGQPDAPAIGKVIIEVRGGVAEVTSQPDDIGVEIIDYDNEDADAAR